MSAKFEFVANTFKALYAEEQGQAIWNYLNTEKSVIRMEAVSDVGKPAVLAVEEGLLSECGVKERVVHGLKQGQSDEADSDENKKTVRIKSTDDRHNDRIKQMIGAMVRQVMEHHGYQLHANNVKIPNSKIFYSAASYRKSS
jgi:hypothetical protein